MYLVENYNILVHHQVPRSPKTNMIDLGVLMTVQSEVEKYHHRKVKKHYSVSQYVNNAWRDVEEHKLIKIWERFLKVLDLIIQDQGGNSLLESNRGLNGITE